MPDRWEHEKEGRDLESYIAIILAVTFWAIAAVAVILISERTDSGSYLISLLEVID